MNDAILALMRLLTFIDLLQKPCPVVSAAIPDKVLESDCPYVTLFGTKPVQYYVQIIKI